MDTGATLGWRTDGGWLLWCEEGWRLPLNLAISLVAYVISRIPAVFSSTTTPRWLDSVSPIWYYLFLLSVSPGLVFYSSRRVLFAIPTTHVGLWALELRQCLAPCFVIFSCWTWTLSHGLCSPDSESLAGCVECLIYCCSIPVIFNDHTSFLWI